MDEPIWIDSETLLIMQSQQIERFGGKAGVLDRGVVESSVNRARNRFHYGEDVDLADLAAAYLFGFARSQGFADGNKRIGVAACLVFLKVNGPALDVPPDDLYAVAMALADERVRMSEAQAASWIRSHRTGDRRPERRG
ncbi:MAG TPA: type II toxin-antitoxin system death-on-curing family toxin [Longimicrobium sp.]|jgi:death-on-curing protein|uniref:type II toxin-antitoxin system death-on-curing family toxin n=1 Tax=Longimicrobium sp. TaxID=2029185 RepID=UPI002EDB05F8